MHHHIKHMRVQACSTYRAQHVQHSRTFAAPGMACACTPAPHAPPQPVPASSRRNQLHAALLGRPAPVVRDGCDVHEVRDLHASRVQRLHRILLGVAGPLDLNLHACRLSVHRHSLNTRCMQMTRQEGSGGARHAHRTQYEQRVPTITTGAHSMDLLSLTPIPLCIQARIPAIPCIPAPPT